MSGADDWLRREVGRVLRAPVVEWSTRPGTYRSSWDLCEVDVQLEDGRRLALVVKRFDVTADPVRKVKPAFLVDPGREIAVYREILCRLEAGTARFYGNTVDSNGGSVLILERVDGTPLWQIGDFATWLRAAAWLGQTHSRLARLHTDRQRTAALLQYDEAYFRIWPERARVCGTFGNYDAVVALLAGLPRTIIHGEFHASNILVGDAGRICVLDWEMAAVGPALMDLADLTSGNWSADERRALVGAYRDTCDVTAAMPGEQFAAGLAACRLHRALQWLGWSDGWSPPPEHVNNWLAEADAAWRELGG